jgi:hypothetical protein
MFNVRDLVYRKLDTPENALGEKQSGKFREGDYRFDRQPRKIEQIFYYNGKKQTYRYMLNGLKNSSFTTPPTLVSASLPYKSGFISRFRCIYLLNLKKSHG